MKRLMIIGLWPDDAVNYCTEKCDCRRYAFDRILYHRGGRAARERICMDPLSIVIGENYCCSAFRCKISAKTTVWHVGFIGLEGDIEICVKIFRYAVRCIKSEQKKLRKQHRDYYTPQEIAKICDSYGYGFARGVYEAFTRQNEENQEYGLVLKVPEEVKDELEKIGPPKEFKKTPQPKTVGELDAAWRGVEDGRKFDPSNKLEEKKQEA